MLPCHAATYDKSRKFKERQQEPFFEPDYGFPKQLPKAILRPKTGCGLALSGIAGDAKTPPTEPSFLRETSHLVRCLSLTANEGFCKKRPIQIY